MKAPFLLDTCAAIWVANKEPVAEVLVQEIQRAESDGGNIYISPVTAWEIGMLASRARINLPVAPERWFANLLQAPIIRLVSLPPGILIASSYLPGDPPNDPIDRIFAATAREYGYTLVTRDRPLLAYAEQGHLKAVAC